MAFKGTKASGPKGYITYPITYIYDKVKEEWVPDINSYGLIKELLEVYHETRRLLKKKKVGAYKGYTKKIYITATPKPFATALEDAGYEIETLHIEGLRGKKSLKVTIMTDTDPPALKDIDLRRKNLQIQKIPGYTPKIGSHIVDIELRINAPDVNLLMKYMDGVQLSLAKWHIEPSYCAWSGGESKEVIEVKPTTVDKVKFAEKQEELKKLRESQKRLENKVEDLQDDVNDLKKQPLKNSIIEERKAREGVLK